MNTAMPTRTEEEAAFVRANRLMGELKASSPEETKTTRVGELIALFKRFPSLTCREFDGCWGETPLLHLLWINVSSVSYKKICGICPNFTQQVLQKTGWGNFLLHRSCSSKSEDEDVPLFIAKEAPEVLAMCDQNKDLPIHIAMRRKRSPSLLGKFLELCPATGAKTKTLQLALEMPDQLKVLSSIMKTFPPQEKKLTVTPDEVSGPVPLSVPQMKILCKLFPRLETLHLEARWQNSKAFLCLVNKIEENQTIFNINCLSLPSLKNLSPCHSGLEQCISVNETLKELHLRLPPEADDTSLGDWIASFLRAFEKNKCVEIFEFSFGKGMSYEKSPDIIVETAPKWLDLLKSQNRTLTKCSPWQSALWEGNTELMYYLELNRHGRSRARDASATKMVELLASTELQEAVRCSEARRSGRNSKTSSTRLAYSIPYELLLQTPASWSNLACSERSLRSRSFIKRKRKISRVYYGWDEHEEDL